MLTLERVCESRKVIVKEVTHRFLHGDFHLGKHECDERIFDFARYTRLQRADLKKCGVPGACASDERAHLAIHVCIFF